MTNFSCYVRKMRSLFKTALFPMTQRVALLFFNSNRSASSFLYVYFIGTVLMTIDTTKFGCCVLFLALTLYVSCSYSTTALVQISNLKYVKMYKF